MTDARADAIHHFACAEQRREASTLGIWVFLATEIMFFGGMFTGHAVYRATYPESFADASQRLNLVLGTINTCVLIGSSLTMALAVRGAQAGSKRSLLGGLILTLGLGAVFLVIKFIEYAHKFSENLVPGPAFSFEGGDTGSAQIFFSFYFAMTGIHALHMVIGIGVLAVLAIMAARGAFSSTNYAPIEMTGLYWHLVDIVWIFLFPLLYLIGRHI